MVFEGDLGSACTEVRSTYTDLELENIRLKNMEVNERHHFIPVPVPESDTCTSIFEDELAKIHKLSEFDLNAMVQQTLDTASNCRNQDGQYSQSLSNVCDLELQKKAKPSSHVESDGENSPDGSLTEMGDDFEDDLSTECVSTTMKISWVVLNRQISSPEWQTFFATGDEET